MVQSPGVGTAKILDILTESLFMKVNPLTVDLGILCRTILHWFNGLFLKII